VNSRRLELATRRGELTAVIAMQRQTLGSAAVPLQALCGVGDRVSDGAGWLKRHPGIVAVAVAAVVILRPKRTYRWARNAFFLWRGWKKLRPVLLG